MIESVGKMDEKVWNRRSINFYYLIREYDRTENKRNGDKISEREGCGCRCDNQVGPREASCTWHRYEGFVSSWKDGRREGKEKGGGEVSLSFPPSHDISRISYNLQCYGDFMYILAELRSPALRSII